MDKVIDWIKKSVGVCASFDTYADNSLQDEFKKLEKEYVQFSQEEKNKANHILISQFDISDLTYILSFFVKYMNISEFEDKVLDCLISTDYDCYTNSMLELQVVVGISGFYEKKRQLHRKNVEKYVSTLQSQYPYIEMKARNKNRIVIITEQILGINHAPTKAVLDTAVAMKKMNYEVMIFVCPSDINIGEGLWHDSISLNCIQDVRNQYFVLGHKGVDLEVYQINMDDEGLNHYKKMLDFIYEYKPLFVYSMGMFNPIGDVPQRFITTVARKYSLGLPVSDADVIVEIKGETSCQDIKHLSEKQKLYEEKSGVNYFEISDNKVTRSELNLPEDKFLITVVGNRLDEEIRDEFISVMEKIGEDISNVGFVVIGKVSKAKERIDKSKIADKVYYLGYCDDIMSIYPTMDLYVNPERKGGGFSSVMALIMGVPVVTLPDCDVAYNVGEDFVVNDYEQMIEQICRYYNDKEYYSVQKSLTKKFADENSVEAAEKSLETRIKNLITYVEDNYDE